MDFTLSDDQHLLRDTARGLLDAPDELCFGATPRETLEPPQEICDLVPEEPEDRQYGRGPRERLDKANDELLPSQRREDDMPTPTALRLNNPSMTFIFVL